MYDELIKRLRECTAEMNGEKTLWHQAADVIEDLENRLNLWRQDKIRRWIPVTERLPEEDERVLVVAHRINDNSPVVSIDSVEVDEGKLRFSLYMGVDYWMPLPEPPKDGES